MARRMEMRTPSLYVYLPSKAALYDEVFAPGWRLFQQTMQEYDVPLGPSETARALIDLRDVGQLAADTDIEQATDVWTLLVSGLISQRLSNEPSPPSPRDG